MTQAYVVRTFEQASRARANARISAERNDYAVSRQLFINSMRHVTPRESATRSISC